MILIIDNGSQYTHLIMRNCRDMGKESQIVNNSSSYERSVKTIEKKVERIILSGGPGSVYAGNNGLSEAIVRKTLSGELDKPLLGICYGHQLIGYLAGADVAKGVNAEYGISEIYVDERDTLFMDVPKNFNAWVSHFDEVKGAPKGFRALAHSDTCAVEAMRHGEKEIFGVQFHPEVWHTENGERILGNFLGEHHVVDHL
jgi:GMP synthase (glutamine-hydrolysing)